MMGAHIGPGPLTRTAAKALTEFGRRVRGNADALARRQRKPERWIPVTITDADSETNTYSGREDAFAADGTRYARPSGRQFGPDHFAKILGIGSGDDGLSTIPAEAWIRHAVTTGEGDFWELDTACKCGGGETGSGHAGGGGGGQYGGSGGGTFEAILPCCPERTTWPNDIRINVTRVSGPCTSFVNEFDNYILIHNPPVSWPVPVWSYPTILEIVAEGGGRPSTSAVLTCETSGGGGIYWALSLNRPFFGCQFNVSQYGHIGVLIPDDCVLDTYTFETSYTQSQIVAYPCCPNGSTTVYRITITAMP
jgi:hypothetical protein